MSRVPRDRARGGRVERRGALGTASSFELVQGELCHSGQDSLGRDACAMLRSPAPGEQPRSDYLGLAVHSCKAFLAGPRPGLLAVTHQTLKGPPGLLAFHTLIFQCLGEGSAPGPSADAKITGCSSPLLKTLCL